VESDLLLHVIDSNDEWIDEKISIVDTTLESIEATQPRLYIFNKIDGLDTKKRKALEKKYRELTPVFVSAMTAEGIDILKERLKEHF
jgi:GTP-binding protein HflX